MKKLVLSVLFGLIVGLAYIAVMLLISMPFLLLIRMGLLGIPTGSSNVTGVISNLTGSIKDISANLEPGAIAILVVQTLLFVALDIVSFVFMTKVMRVFLKDDMYFRHLYDGVFVFVMLIPEILVILATFVNFPLTIALILILCITFLVAGFATVMATKVLPDLNKNQNRKYLLKTNTKE